MEQAAQVKRQFGGTALKNFICKKISDCMEQSQSAFTIPTSLVSMLTHFHKMPIQVGQTVEWDAIVLALHTFRNFSEKNKHSSSKHIKTWTTDLCK